MKVGNKRGFPHAITLLVARIPFHPQLQRKKIIGNGEK